MCPALHRWGPDKRYKALADATHGVHFVGRLATYKYYNMDQVTAQALQTFRKLSAATSLDRTVASIVLFNAQVASSASPA